MEIETHDGIILPLPEGMDPEGPEMRKRVADIRRQRALQGITAEMPWHERIAANAGAGVDTLWQGAKQLVGRGMTDAEIEEKRERDQILADSTAGGGLWQLAGEVAPTMIGGAGLARGLGALGSRLGVTPWIGRGLNATMGRKTQAALGGAAGAAGGTVLTPTKSDESRVGGAAIAAGLGGAIPVVGPLVGKGAGAFGRAVSDTGAYKAARDVIADTLDDRLPQVQHVLQRALAARSGPTVRGRPVEVPTSAAQATGDAGLAQLEAQSRSAARAAPGWQDFEAQRNRALFGVTQDMAPSENAVRGLERMRERSTEPLRQGALQLADERGGFVAPVLQYADQMLEGPAGVHAGVQMAVRKVLQGVGPDARGGGTAARLYETRKALLAGLKPGAPIGDQEAAALKGATREVMQLVSQIDDALDASSDGQWRRYLDAYQMRSRPVESGAALRGVADTIAQKPLVGSSLETMAPQVTGDAFRKIAARETEGKFGSMLGDTATRDVEALQGALNLGEMAGRSRKLAATMGGGSITNSDQRIAALMRRTFDYVPGLNSYLTRLGEANQDKVEREMARLLQNPAALQQALSELKPGRSTQLAIDVLRAVGATPERATATLGAGAGIASAQP